MKMLSALLPASLLRFANIWRCVETEICSLGSRVKSGLQTRDTFFLDHTLNLKTGRCFWRVNKNHKKEMWIKLLPIFSLIK